RLRRLTLRRSIGENNALIGHSELRIGRLSIGHPGDGETTSMSTSLSHDLPEVLQTVRTRPLFVMHLDVRKLQIIGATPGAFRRIGVVPTGSFMGERLSGEILEGGSDWQTIRGDGSMTLNVRLVLR